MSQKTFSETFIEAKVTYSIAIDGNFYVVENVPARVCVETGEKFFAPETVERIQTIIWEKQEPVRMIQTPVYAF